MRPKRLDFLLISSLHLFPHRHLCSPSRETWREGTSAWDRSCCHWRDCGVGGFTCAVDKATDKHIPLPLIYFFADLRTAEENILKSTVVSFFSFFLPSGTDISEGAVVVTTVTHLNPSVIALDIELLVLPGC